MATDFPVNPVRIAVVAFDLGRGVAHTAGMSQILSERDLEIALADLEGWVFEHDSLVRTYEFAGFREAVAFMVRLSYEAEEMNHHPELLNVYNRVRIRLTTHDVGGKVTEKDLKLARKIVDTCLPR